ncbi:MAG TPA: hypothetical protein VGA40_08740 [Candidatus Acidoferrales bacterium]
MNYANLDWYTICLASAAVLMAAGGVLFWWRHRPRDPEEIERRRRAHLNRVGRIVEGEILEVMEAPPEAAPVKSRMSLFAARPAVRANGVRQLLFYKYSISGVTYETAQDVTGMEERAQLKKIVLGQPASVKYDPANPSNSILISDDWSGLH